MICMAGATVGRLEVILVSVARADAEIVRACLQHNDSDHEEYAQRYGDRFD
jgi:hypothetical protein